MAGYNSPSEGWKARLEEMRKHDQQARAMRATQMIEKFASTLCYRQVKTSMQSSGPAPAWSTDASIGFTEDALSDLRTVEGILSVKGLAVHEVSHILFTPRVGSDIVQWVRASGFMKAFNVLEDQRIETLLVGRFGRSVVPWLTATIAKHLLANPNGADTAYALIRGRKYLPVAVRAAFRDLYTNQQDLDELGEVIDAYRTMVFPQDQQDAKDLIIRMDALIQSLPEPPHGNCSDKTPDSYSSSPDSRPLKPRDQKRAQDSAKKRKDEDEDIVKPRKRPKPPKSQDEEQGDDAQDGEGESSDEQDATQEPQDGAEGDESGEAGDESSDESDDAEGDADGEGEEGDEEGEGAGDGDDEYDEESDSADGDSAGKGKGKGGDKSSDGDADSEGSGSGDGDSESEQQGDGDEDGGTGSDAGGQGVGDGEGDHSAPSLDEVEDMLRDAIEQASETLNESLHRDLGEMNGDLDLRSNDAPAAKPREVQHRVAEAETVRAARAFGRELERVKADNDPGWERVTNSGRISTSRYMRGAPLDEAFDRWQIGRDDVSDIEAVICLDSSGSMDSLMGKASDAMWGIKRSLDMIGASCTVVTYDSGYPQMLYKADEKATASVKYARPSGGTNPTQAVKFATRVLAESSRAVKILFNITDGEWGENKDVDMQIRMLRQSGVLTAFAMIGESRETNMHNHEVVAKLQNASDLLILGRQVVNMATDRQFGGR